MGKKAAAKKSDCQPPVRELFADAVVVVDGEDVPVSSVVLRLASPVFDAMFSAEAAKDRRVVVDIATKSQFETFYAFLLPVTSRFVCVSEDNVDGLLLLAEYYHVPGLKDECMKQLQRLQTPEAAVRALQATLRVVGALQKPTSNEAASARHMASADAAVIGLISMGNDEVPVSSAILRLASPVFAAMFASDMLESHESRVSVDFVTSDAFELFYSMLLPVTGRKVPVTVETVDEILVLADYYQVQTLRDECVALLLSVEPAPSVPTLIQGADFHIHEQYERCAEAIAAEPFAFELSPVMARPGVMMDVVRRIQRHTKAAENWQKDKQTLQQVCAFKHAIWAGANACSHHAWYNEETALRNLYKLLESALAYSEVSSQSIQTV